MRRWRRLLRSGNAETPDLESLLADIRSDAFQYLDEAATSGERYRSLIDRVDETRASLERAGRWEETYEWRIATEGTDRLEVASGRYRAWSDHHGVFTAEFKTFAEAFEGLAVLGEIQKDLFYAVGWSSWAGRGRISPDDPPFEADDDDDDDEDTRAYLVRLGEEARTQATALLPDVEAALNSARSWDDETAARELRVSRAVRRNEDRFMAEVSCRTLSMSTDAATVERALEFLGIYERLQGDLAHHLEWRWL